MRSEVETLKFNLDQSRSELNKKELELENIRQRTNKIAETKSNCEDESIIVSNRIKELSEELGILELIITNFQTEREQWKLVDFNSPIEYLLDKSNFLEIYKEIFIDRSTFNNLEFCEFKKGFVEVSMNSPSFSNAVANSLFFKNDLLVKDVNCFNSTIYSLLKQINNRHINYNSKEVQNYFKTQRVILQGNIKNFFEPETYLFSASQKFKIERISKLIELENNLLNLLNNENKDLKSILSYQIELQGERNLLFKEEIVRSLYRLLNSSYEQINKVFKNEYQIQLPFNIYREFIEHKEANIQEDVVKDILEFFKYSFKNALKSDTDQIYLDSVQTDTSFFEINEVEKFSFDYTFITDFNDILYEVHKVLKIDYEISAGSPESNAKIFSLLSDSSNKTILVKNIEFLPSCIKTGKNRFIFIIGKNECHPLMIESRIVYLDKNSSFSVIFDSILKLMKTNRTITPEDEKRIRFYSLGVSLSLDFSIRDLEIALDHSYLGFDFITKCLFLSKISSNEVDILQNCL